MNRYAAAVWLGFFLASASAVAQNAAAPAAAKPAAPVASTEKATYVGSEVCMSCHEDIGKAFAKNPHEAVETGSVKKYGFKGQACESCHGPGSNHITSLSPADIRNPAKLPAAETDKPCLTCHRNEPTQAGRLDAIRYTAARTPWWRGSPPRSMRCAPVVTRLKWPPSSCPSNIAWWKAQ